MTHAFIFLKIDSKLLLAPHIPSSRILSVASVASNTGHMMSVPPHHPTRKKLIVIIYIYCSYPSFIHHLQCPRYCAHAIPAKTPRNDY